MNHFINKYKPKTCNQRMIWLTLYGANRPEIDISDPKQVEKRVDEYIEFCLQKNLFPSICGCASWIGVHRTTIHDWYRGSPQRMEHSKIIRQFYALLEECYVEKMMEDKSPSTWIIFVLKAWFGYADRVDLSLGNGSYSDFSNPKQIRELLESLPESSSTETNL